MGQNQRVRRTLLRYLPSLHHQGRSDSSPEPSLVPGTRAMTAQAHVSILSYPAVLLFARIFEFVYLYN